MADIFSRSREEKIANITVSVVVGGCGGHSKPERIEVKEMPIVTTKKHLSMAADAIFSNSQEHKVSWGRMLDLFRAMNAPTITEADRCTRTAGFAEDVKKFLGVTDLLAEILADTIGKDVDYINYECSAPQVSRLVSAYITVVGWDYIKEMWAGFFSMGKGKGGRVDELIKAVSGGS